MSTGKDQSIGLTATCTDDSITLHFDEPGTYRIWRKRPADVSWGRAIWERRLGTDYVDQDGIEQGLAYEYKVLEMMTGATGYILAGSKIPLIDNRGKLVLIVERTHADALAKELAQFVQDLVGDGWTVLRHDVSKDWLPELVKSYIKAEWELDKENVKAAVLFGSIPVKRSGNYTYDGHSDHVGAMAADTFYADVTGDWSGSPSIIPAKLKLVVGRIDMSNLVCYANKPNNPRTELDLLRQYLNRNHEFRTGQWNVRARGAVCDNFPDYDFSANGWRNFPQAL